VLVSGTVFQDRKGAGVVSSAAFQLLAEQAATIGGVRGPCYAYSAEHQLLLQVFPLDSELPGLVRAADEFWVRKAFAEALGVPRESVRVMEASFLAYKPSRRCMFGYEIEGAGVARRYFAKVLHGGRGEQLLAWLKVLRERLHIQGAPWDTPAPSAYLEEAQMLVLEALDGAVDGRTLEAQAATGNAEARRALHELVAAAAHGLPTFQRTIIPELTLETPSKVLGDLAKNVCFLPGLQRAAPSMAGTLISLVRRLEDTAIRLTPEPAGLGHGSFRHTHFMLHRDRHVLVDLDGLCLCGVSADAGKFLACLDRSGLRRPQSRAILKECEEIFLSGLRNHPTLSLDWLTWYRAVTLVTWAMRSFSSLSFRWLQVSEELVHLSDHLLSGVSTATGHARASVQVARIQGDEVIATGPNQRVSPRAVSSGKRPLPTRNESVP
jgi:hypothetical protein